MSIEASGNMWKQIESARRQGLLSDLDVHFARFVADCDSAHPPGSPAALASAGRAASPLVLLAAALLSQLTSVGHVCLDLAALAEQPVLDGSFSAPPLDIWMVALNEHPACGKADAYTPLCLDGSRLYMRRYFDYECAVAQAWRADTPVTLSAALEVQLVGLFPRPDTGEDPLRDQRAAATAALQQQRVLISGGPGTGKTTTLASILALLLAQHQGDSRMGDESTIQRALCFEAPPASLKILLSAPTGKAAARMQDAIRAAKTRLPLEPAIMAAMPETAQTLHRLLGARPQGGGMVWRHDADNPLVCDVLVVDEASMIDLALMARLLAALPANARLILLGDRDQLASVDAGAVFADLCSAGAVPGRSADGVQSRSVETSLQYAGRPLTAILGHSFRFDAASGIGNLAAMLRAGDADAALRLLQQTSPDLQWSDSADRQAVVAYAAQRYADFISAAATLAPAAIFERFAAFRLLTPLRRGPLGIDALNTAIERALVACAAIAPRNHWYAGKPVMIAANDYALHLFNGDIGICMTDSTSGELRIAFPAEDGVRLLAPARLPAHETAWAMTVHKSQGSEFDEVALVLPAEQSDLLTRELVYTAVTRARRSVAIWAEAAVLRATCKRRIVRHSGLVERLQSM